VLTATRICSTTGDSRVDIGHRLERCANLGNATSWPPARTRGRRTATFRPPSTTSLLTVYGIRRAALGHVGIVPPAEGRPILFQHRFQHRQAKRHRELE
jgi:hypothetical protein